MKKIACLLFTAIIIFTITGSTFAQGKLGVVGKIYTKTEANSLYGSVLQSVNIDTKVLKSALDRVGDYVMFKIKDGKLVLTNEYKASLTSEYVNITSDETMYLYSKSKVLELLNSSGQPVTTVELRSEVLTITNGATTLEFAALCPPICP
ncbi:MAG: hypothetical protein A2V66_11390 [Ignavibacteria bacterium RBG_13_36_8]|nr:MAG: hypothetical protein A2V66_11390 [Ignavibacteria bacterium RBG_13_36_8]